MKREEINAPRNRTLPRDAHQSQFGLGIVLMLIAVTVGGAALTKTLVKNKTHAMGRDQQAVEHQIASLEQEIRALELNIKEVLAPKHLKDRLATQRTQLKEIEKKNIINIPAVPVAKVPGTEPNAGSAQP
jgi:TolA-binding protein